MSMAANIFDFNDAPVQPRERAPVIGGLQDFIAVMQKAGLHPPENIRPETILRFRIDGDKGGEKSGWCVYHDCKYPVGSYGDWRSGEIYSWQGYNEYELNSHERRQAEAERKAAQARQEALLAAEREQCRKTSLAWWNNARPAHDHPYLARKKIAAGNLRQYDNGELLIPVIAPDESLVGLQRIDPDGRKSFLPGTDKKGSFYRFSGSGQIAICEGYATGASVHEATGWTVYVAFDAGNLMPVASWLKERFPEADIVNCGDDDCWKERNTGREKAALLDAALLIRSVFPKFLDTSQQPTDWNDLACLEGLDEVRRQLTATDTAFIYDTPASLRDLPDTDWIIHDILPEQGFAAIYGEPGAGKSFLALDLAYAIAGGRSWFDMPVEQKPVTYIACEAGRGIKVRSAAWESRHGYFNSDNLKFVVRSRFGLARQAELLAKEQPKGSVIIIDTLATSWPGLKENDPADMGIAVDALERIAAITEGLVICVHHCGKDKNAGLRGHTTLLGALDVVINVSRKDDERKWTLEKSKEGEDGISREFELEKIELGVNAKGFAISSCVVNYGAAPKIAAKKSKPLSQNLQACFDALKEAIAESGEAHVDLETWRAYHYASIAVDNPESKRTIFGRAHRKLLELGIVIQRDGFFVPKPAPNSLDFNADETAKQGRNSGETG